MDVSSRIVICLLVVLGNAGIWGDASIDTVLAQTYGYTKQIPEAKNCMRPCKFGQKPKRCSYEFFIKEGIFQNQTSMMINKQVPGPSIQVCVGDIVEVTVHNKLGGAELGIHWVGMLQRGSPHMDGVPMITQCPITAGTSYTYVFKAENVGTHYYRAHSVSHQLLGIFGSLIVKQPSPLESAINLYQHDRSDEHLILISTRTNPLRIMINELNDNENKIISVVKGQKYRIRIVNSIPLDCPLIISSQEHKMTIISSDGRPVKPTDENSFLLLPGERFDFVLNAAKYPSVYNLNIDGINICKGLHQKALIVYEGTNYTKSDNTAASSNEHISNKNPFDLLFGQKLLSTVGPPAEVTISPVADETVYLQIDANKINVKDSDNEYRYLSDAMPVPEFYPAILTIKDENRVVQINKKNFLYPNAPLLSQSSDIVKRIMCPVGREYKTSGVECMQILEVDYKSTLELIIVDEGFGSASNKTFYMHGNPMYVLTTSSSYKYPLHVYDIEDLELQGRIKRNLFNPPQKDTVVVPNKGFVIVRIVADNPGTWMFECRSCGVASLPAAIVIKVQPQLSSKISKVIPKCGNFRPADTLLT